MLKNLRNNLAFQIKTSVEPDCPSIEAPGRPQALRLRNPNLYEYSLFYFAAYQELVKKNCRRLHLQDRQEKAGEKLRQSRRQVFPSGFWWPWATTTEEKNKNLLEKMNGL